MREIVIVGASLAGTRTAQALREAGYDGGLTLVGREAHPPYDRPPLTKSALVRGPSLEELALPGAAALEARWLRGRSAIGVDVADRRVQLDHGERLSFDGLVIATGANARRLRTSEVGPVVHHVRTYEDSARLHRALARADLSVLVIGAGLLGSEIASVASARGHRVTLVEAAHGPVLGVFGPELSAYCARLHRDHGAELRTSSALVSLCPENWRGERAAAVLENRATGDRWTTRADVVVAALGTSPATDWLRHSGLDVEGGVRTDSSLTVLDRRGLPVAGVVAVGDVARSPQPLVGGIARRVEHWTAAVGHSELAAATLLGRLAVPAPVPSFGTELHGQQIRAVGMPAAGDTTTIVSGAPEHNHFVATRTLHGRLVGAIAVNDAPALLPYRTELETQTASTLAPAPGGRP
jgi:3-phenylpropionate/trans-cinnamate dioxygenase ferredoxin reductase subunit